MSEEKKISIKLSPRKLAKIIAECACDELNSAVHGVSPSPAMKPATSISAAPSQSSVDAGLFPGMGDTPALSDTGNSSGGCGDSPDGMSPPSVVVEPPIDSPEPVSTNTDLAVLNDDDDDANSVELVIGNI